MSNRIPPKLPENLIGFAQLAHISEESLGQILKKLKQAGIEINDPHEKLSQKIKAQLLAFFQGKTGRVTGVKQTHISQLKSGLGSAKNVTITTVTRKSAKAVSPAGERHQHESPVDLTNIKATTVAIDPSPSMGSSEIASVGPSIPSESSSKKQKTTASKKRARLASPSKPAKRSKHKSNHLSEEAEWNDDEEERASHASIFDQSAEKISEQNTGPLTQTFQKPVKPMVREVWISEQVTAIDLARKMSIKDAEIITHLEKMGVLLERYDEPMDQDTAFLLVQEMGHRPRLLLHNAKEISLRESIDKQMGEAQKRPPIITVMGHVDHGKTTLLDDIRQTTVAAGEAGGITQHIAAYHVQIPKGIITFLDTPGHGAFTAMRARGARLTDIVVLVVAADDGVMPQTVEAIEHAQAANVPIVVAINKMDKPGSTVDLVQQGLAKYHLIPEDWGGETLFVPISAKTGEGIDDLLDALLLQAEIAELKAPMTGPAQGIIIESRLSKGQGSVATMIVQKGTLKKGDIVLAGMSFGRIRALNDENGKAISSATPSIPVEILGLSKPPAAGEEAIVVPNERTAREIVQARLTAARESQIQAQTNHLREAFMDPFRTLHKSIPVILKADVQGSAEALKESLLKLSTKEVTMKILMTGVGEITESDVNLAIASKAIIFGFNVRTDKMAQREKVIIYHHSIIYELLDEAKKIVSNLSEPQIKENILGQATVREIFRVAKTGVVAGCLVTEGAIHSHHSIRIVRHQAVIHQGKLHSLRRFKDDVKAVHTGAECGISIKNYTDLQVGDRIESYERTPVMHKG